MGKKGVRRVCLDSSLRECFFLIRLVKTQTVLDRRSGLVFCSIYSFFMRKPLSESKLNEERVSTGNPTFITGNEKTNFLIETLLY